MCVVFVIVLVYYCTLCDKLVWLDCHYWTPIQLSSSVGGMDNMSLLSALQSESTAANGNRYVTLCDCFVTLSAAANRFYSDVRLLANGFGISERIGTKYSFLSAVMCILIVQLMGSSALS